MNYNFSIGIIDNIKILIDLLSNTMNRIGALSFNSTYNKIGYEQNSTQQYLDNIEAQQQITELQLKIIELGGK